MNVADAYVDRLILNVYAGPGLTQVWTDDAEVGPIAEDEVDGRAGPADHAVEGRHAGRARVETSKRTAAVEFNRDQLRVGGRPMFFRGIRHSDTPLKTLRDAGFNTLFVGDTARPGASHDEAVKQGFWLVPTLPGRPAPTRSASAATATASRPTDAVLFWDLGGDRRPSNYELTPATAQAVRAVDPQRPLAADVWDGLCDLLAATSTCSASTAGR